MMVPKLKLPVLFIFKQETTLNHPNILCCSFITRTFIYVAIIADNVTVYSYILKLLNFQLK